MRIRAPQMPRGNTLHVGKSCPSLERSSKAARVSWLVALIGAGKEEDLECHGHLHLGVHTPRRIRRMDGKGGGKGGGGGGGGGIRRRRQQRQLAAASQSIKPRTWQSAETAAGADARQFDFVLWFRQAWPYIQGHRGSTLVLVIPGEVAADRHLTDRILQDVALLHGLGIKIVLVPGAHLQIDELLQASIIPEKGVESRSHGAYRITDDEALEAAMECAGRIRIDMEARLSRGPSIPVLRRHGESDRWHEVGVSITSGNYVAAKRKGVVDGVDFGATGEVKKVDVARIRERLDNNCIVMLSNLGYSATGEVLNCNTYEVATACAVALGADKLICLLDGPMLDERKRLLRWMTLHEADQLIRARASQSYVAADYVKAAAGADYLRSLGLSSKALSGPHEQQAASQWSSGSNGVDHIRFHGNGRSFWAGESGSRSDDEKHHHQEGNGKPCRPLPRRGIAVGGEERYDRTFGYLSEMAAAVFACRNGVRRVHLLDSNVEGVLLLELYTRDGSGCMVSSDSYEGVRPARARDVSGISALLKPLEEEGVLVHRPKEQIMRELNGFTVVEREGHIVACAALLPYEDHKCAEVAAFAVSPECRGQGLGDTLLDYLEKKAIAVGLDHLFLLTTRTADWFKQRGFEQCDSCGIIPEERCKRINPKRGSKYFMKQLHSEFTGTPS
eukprot:SM000029S10458  [mRNA]  locus=s29:246061:251286:- [translate_table: standard]